MRPYFRSLDGLRCLAILPVVWHHSTQGPLEGVLGRGPLGVDLFFALSGFLITSLLLHEREVTSRALLVRIHADESTALVFVTSTLASIAVATLTYRFIESPFLALRGRFDVLSSRSARASSR